MIVCHCQNISDHQIRAAVDWMRAADPMTVITPGKVYHALGKRPDCGGCMPLFLDTMRSRASFMIARTGPRQDRPAMPHLGTGTGRHHEGRSQSHRLSERGAEI